MEHEKLLADYLGYEYIPFNNLQGFRKPGFYRPSKTGSSYEEMFRKTSNDYYVGRNLRELKLKKDYNKLFEVISKLEKEDLRQYMYSWDEGNDKHYNFEGIEVSRFHGVWDCNINLSLDPPIEISDSDSYKNLSDKEQLFQCLVNSVKYINSIKNEK